MMEKSMMKGMKSLVAISTVICLVLLGSMGAVQAQKLKKTTVTIGAQNQKSAHGGFADLLTEKVYSLSTVSGHEGDIDLVYAWGKTTKVNLMAPSSPSLKY